MRLFIFTMLLSFNLFAQEGLKVGQDSPVKELTTVSEKSVDLSKGQNILVFYRGSWCPYCMTQLKSIQTELISKLPKGTKLIGISVDKPMIAKKMKRNHKITFPIVSNPSADLLSKFKITNKISDELVAKYKNSYKIDIENDSGETHHMIAHPAVYIIKDGKIIFADIHIDYKQRTPNDEILKAIK